MASGRASAAFWDDAITERFIGPPTFTSLSLAPDGAHLAALRIDEEGHSLAIVRDFASEPTASPIREMRVETNPDQRDDFAIYWRSALSIGWMSADTVAVAFTRCFARAYSPDGTGRARLGCMYVGNIRPDGQKAPWAVTVHEPRGAVQMRPISDMSASVIMGPNLPAGEIVDWSTDETGTTRIARTTTSSAATHSMSVTTWYRDGEGRPWRAIDERSITDEPFYPLGVSERPHEIFVRAWHGADKAAIWHFDVDSRAWVDEAVSDRDADLVPIRQIGKFGGLKGVETDGLTGKTAWLDPRMARLQASVDAALPGRRNRLQATTGDRVLIESSSDIDPGTVWLLDLKTMKMEESLRMRPDIHPADMQPVHPFRYRAADGLAIPAYLTLPGDPAGPAPMVVLIHGGPQARDRLEWDAEVQNLAAHGYAVFQPQFRGSTGFGRRLEEAGYGQWGQAMQDDITAGVRYLIDRKIADPARICIVGASYGGYAALWGLVKTPALYQCGVSVAGVSDLQAELTRESDISRNDSLQELVHRRIGDPSSMASAFEQVSPLRHADQIRVPVLLVHGVLDERVPLSQGTRMRDALKAQKKDVTWLAFDDEAHSLAHRENQRRYYKALFKLLSRTIGSGVEPRTAGRRVLREPLGDVTDSP